MNLDAEDKCVQCEYVCAPSLDPSEVDALSVLPPVPLDPAAPLVALLDVLLLFSPPLLPSPMLLRSITVYPISILDPERPGQLFTV